MNVMVTGGSGAIGSMVAGELVEDGVRPVIYDVIQRQDLMKKLAKDADIINGDILDLAKLIDTAKKFKVEQIVHTAAFLHEGNPFTSLRVNAIGTYNILETARLLGTERVVHTSTTSLIGSPSGKYSFPSYEPVDEEHPQRPDTFYGISKQLAELYGLQYAADYGVNYIALRFSSIYGPGRLTGRNPYAVFDNIVSDAVDRKPVQIRGGGEAKNDWVYIKDVAHGIFLATKLSKPKHRVFHISTGRGRTMVEVKNILDDLLPGSSIKVQAGHDLTVLGAGTGSVLNINRAKQELGYAPKYHLEEGLRDYAEVLKSAKQ